MRLDSIAINKFAPFGAQKCEFGRTTAPGWHADVHIFVGENGTGKTRLLSLLLAACGNSKELDDRTAEPAKAAVVAEDPGKNKVMWFTQWGVAHTQSAEQVSTVVNQYPASGSPNLAWTGQPNLFQLAKGTAAMAFRSVAAIRDEKVKPMAAVEWGAPADFLLFSRPPKDNTSLCQAISNMKIRAGMYIAGNPGERADRTVRMTERLEKTLESITGRPFIFVVEQDGTDVRLKVSWGGVRMRLQQLPDGLRAVIGWLATCVAKLDILLPDVESPLEQPILLFLDEPETHLHPAWQRHVLPALQLLLPHAQIFVATHSPFVVSSVNDGWIYVLKSGPDGSVQIHGPKECSKGDTYIDAVEDALGLKEWYDPETESMLSRFRKLRDAALKSFATSDKDAMVSLAQEIAKRSESLDVMMGQELAQFAAKEKSAGR